MKPIRVIVFLVLWLCCLVPWLVIAFVADLARDVHRGLGVVADWIEDAMEQLREF